MNDQSVMAQKKKKNDNQNQVEKKDDKKSQFKKYNDLITKDAISDDGLFSVHKVEDKYYYGIVTGFQSYRYSSLRWQSDCIQNLEVLLQSIKDELGDSSG